MSAPLSLAKLSLTRIAPIYGSLRELSQSAKKRPFNPAIADKSVSHLPTLSLMKEWALLRAMRITSLHPLANFAIENSLKNDLVGTCSSHLVRPWFQQFCVQGTPAIVVAAAVQKNLNPDHIIFDYATEGIPDASHREETEKQYLAYLRHPTVKMIAVKLSGLCPIKILESGQYDHPHYCDALASLEKVVATAHELGKIVVFDAEQFSVESMISHAALKFAKIFPKNVMLTVQATRRDSVSRLQSWSEEIPEGERLMVKLVKGAYKSDRDLHKEALYQDFPGTHQNYIDLLTIGATHPKIAMLPCTHNLDLIDRSVQSGFKKVGNLSGMEVAKGLSEDLAEVRYFIGHHDPLQLVDYIKRRFHEHGEALQPRRELLLLAALRFRLENSLSYWTS